MLTKDDYELLPHEEIEYLRREVEKLKADPFGKTEHGKSLRDSIESLTHAVNDLLHVFVEADKKLADQYEHNHPSEALSHIKHQNDTIAKGILALADIIKAKPDAKSVEPPRPSQPKGVDLMQQQSMMPPPRSPIGPSQPRPVAPRPDPSLHVPDFKPPSLDDFTPEPPEKKSFFGRLKK